jgi:hypothetical protein
MMRTVLEWLSLVLSAVINPTKQRPLVRHDERMNDQLGGGATRPGFGSSRAYFHLVLLLTLAIALASFGRVREQGLHNVSLWIFAVPFAVTLARTGAGLVVAVFFLQSRRRCTSS